MKDTFCRFGETCWPEMRKVANEFFETWLYVFLLNDDEDQYDGCEHLIKKLLLAIYVILDKL